MTDIEIRCPSCGMCYRGERESLVVPRDPNGVPQEVARLLSPVLELISSLMTVADADSPEEVLLQNLTNAVRVYELNYFPVLGRTEGAPE